jgi:hypothetical protein
MDAGPFTGRAAFVTALKEAVVKATATSCREMFWLDANFVDWPLSDAEVLSALTTWARPPHCLHLLALDFEALRLSHPQFVRWRGTYGHCVRARAVDPELASSLTSGGVVAALLAPPLSVRLFDAASGRGTLSLEPLDALRIRERFDALAQRSSESFAATTLGL